MADVELLPLPEGEAIGWTQAWSYDQMRSYARANVSHATARLQAEVEALRAEVERLRADRDSWEQQASDRVADWHAEHLRAERLLAEVERLRTDLMESDEIREKLGHLLTRTAAALKGEPPAGVWHSWHDLPEKAAQLAEALLRMEEREQRDEALLRGHDQEDRND